MPVLIALPVLSVLVILQSAVVSRMALLHGTADLLLLAVVAWALQKRVATAWAWAIIAGLIVTLVSAMPLGVPVIEYALAVGLALMLRRRVWQAPILAMFAATLGATLLAHSVDIFTLRLTGMPLPLFETINLITLPSILLNFLFAIPIYALMTDLANWLYPEEIEV